MTEDPIVKAGGAPVICCCPTVAVDEPTTKTVCEKSVCKATIVVAPPDPTVMVEPGTSV